MFEQTALAGKRSAWGDWMLRIAIALAFILFGSEKFTEAYWVDLFRRIGYGQWFRYFTGVVEIAGALLVVLPWTANAGLALCAATMLGATLTHIVLLGHPADCIVPATFFAALAGFWWSRRTA